MSPTSVRKTWVDYLIRVVKKPIEAQANGKLRATMPIESKASRENRYQVTHLEAIGRALSGTAPWLELKTVPEFERDHQLTMRHLAQQALRNAVDPNSPDYLNFSHGQQPLVDAAFLAQALIRAPKTLWYSLDKVTQDRLIDALRSSHIITPGYNNWLLFSATVEIALLKFTGEADMQRIDYAVRSLESWYKGDSIYGDGPEFHWDYYNSYVIQPMLLDILEAAESHNKAWREMLPNVRTRAVRYASILEKLVAPDGSFPAIGRSLAYRCGAMHHLANMALRHELPGSVQPAQARCALTKVIERTLGAHATFDEQGWLQVGLCGHQPSIGEEYISTGSLYLCSTAFLPLGLPSNDLFWSQDSVLTTSEKAWSGINMNNDHALVLEKA
jgi:hypothetical protein